MGNLLKDRHNVESPRKDLCFVHAHLSTNAKTEKVTKGYLLLSQNENYLQKENSSMRERLQGSYPRGISFGYKRQILVS